MTTIQRNVQGEDIRQSAKHVLFVEGNDDNGLDPLVLSELLPIEISVKPLGASYHIRSAAEALHKHHPSYYFLIDRDHHEDDFINNCWKNFPDESKSNLLVWFRRELENYFLIPEYLKHSKYLTATSKKLLDSIRKHCQQRLYLDVANQVIVSLREDFKLKWIDFFEKIKGFESKELALKQLKERPEFKAKIETTSSALDILEVERRFHAKLHDFTEGNENLDYGSGRWLELVRGKKVLPSVIKECFTVADAQGTPLQAGRESIKEIAKDLLGKGLDKQPDDFQRLYKIISARIASS